MDIVTDFIFLGCKITADSDCSHEIKRCLFLGRNAMTNLDSILTKQRLLFCRQTSLQLKPWFFQQSCKNVNVWTIKKAECQRIDAFELWCWRRLLRFSWTARRSNKSILKKFNPEYSLEGLMLKLELQSFGPLMHRADSQKRLCYWEKLRASGEGSLFITKALKLIYLTRLYQIQTMIKRKKKRCKDGSSVIWTIILIICYFSLCS